MIKISSLLIKRLFLFFSFFKKASGYPYLEISAKTGEGIDDAMEMLIDMIEGRKPVGKSDEREEEEKSKKEEEERKRKEEEETEETQKREEEAKKKAAEEEAKRKAKEAKDKAEQEAKRKHGKGEEEEEAKNQEDGKGKVAKKAVISAVPKASVEEEDIFGAGSPFETTPTPKQSTSQTSTTPSPAKGTAGVPARTDTKEEKAAIPSISGVDEDDLFSIPQEHEARRKAAAKQKDEKEKEGIKLNVIFSSLTTSNTEKFTLLTLKLQRKKY